MNYKQKKQALFSLALLCLCLTLSVAAQTPGTLDTTFGNGGKLTTTPPAPFTGFASDVAVQTDGKIVLAGSCGSNIAHICVFRYLPNGTADTSFGTNGFAVTNFTTSDMADAVAIQPDGKIVITGITILGSANNDFVVVRFNTDGSLDTTFGAGGKVTANIFALEESKAIVIQPDGKIIIAGITQRTATSLFRSFFVIRFNVNGSLDTTFGTGGKITTDIGLTAGAEDVILQSDGKIIAVGFVGFSSGLPQMAIVRYQSNGSLDTSFDNDGITTVAFDNFSAQAKSIAIQTDGKIVVAGEAFVSGTQVERFALTRLLPDGSLDATLGTAGRVITSFDNGGAARVYGVGIQQNGKIVVGGYIYVNQARSNDFALVRYNANGAVDTTFGTNGVTLTDFGNNNFSSDQGLAGLVIQADGKIVLAGGANNGVFFAVARYNGDPVTPIVIRRVPVDFNGDGKTDFALGGLQRPGDNIPNPQQLVWYIQPNTYPLAPPVSSTDPNYFYRTSFGLFNGFNNPASDVPVPEDFDGDGKADIAVWRAGTNGGASYFYVLQSSTNTFFPYQFGKAGDNPRVSGDYDGDGKADFAVYRPAQSVNASDPCGATNQGGTASGGFYYHPSGSPNTFFLARCFGTNDALPIKGDFNGDGKLDFAVQLQSDAGNAAYFINYSSTSVAAIDNVLVFGYNTDAVMPGDFDGDGKTDIAVLRPTGFSSTDNYKISVITATGTVLFSEFSYGYFSDFPAPGDYNGDGKADIAFYRQSTGRFYVHFTGLPETSANYEIPFGANSDLPIGIYNVFSRLFP